MNLGGLLDGLENGKSNNLIENNKTILIVAIVALIIFGFGYGRSMFGGPGFEGPVNYEEARYYGNFNPSDNPKNKKNKHKRHKNRHRDEEEYDKETQYEEKNYKAPEMTGPLSGIRGSSDMGEPYESMVRPENMSVPPIMP